MGRPGAKKLGIADQGKIRLEVGRFGSDIFGNSLSADFFVAFEDDANIQRQRARGSHQRLQRLDLRPHLALVVTGAAAIEVAVALCWLEGRRKPLVVRIGGLHIVVAVKKRGGLTRRM